MYATVSSVNGRRRLEGVTAVEGRHLARLGHGFVELGGPCASPEPTLAGGVVRAFRRAALTRRGEAWALPLARARVDRRAVDARTRRSRRSARRSPPSRRRARDPLSESHFAHFRAGGDSYPGRKSTADRRPLRDHCATAPSLLYLVTAKADIT